MHVNFETFCMFSGLKRAILDNTNVNNCVARPCVDWECSTWTTAQNWPFAGVLYYDSLKKQQGALYLYLHITNAMVLFWNNALFVFDTQGSSNYSLNFFTLVVYKLCKPWLMGGIEFRHIPKFAKRTKTKSSHTQSEIVNSYNIISDFRNS